MWWQLRLDTIEDFLCKLDNFYLMKCFENFYFENTLFPKYAPFLFSIFISVMWFYAQVPQRNLEWYLTKVQ